MSELLNRFRTIHGQNTKQIGRYFCFPAAVSNALRLIGGDDFSQERIRDVWYQQQNRAPELSLDEQMKDAGPAVVDALRARTDFSKRFSTEPFERPRENSPFHCAKANEALQFASDHVESAHPVLISTDHLVNEPGVTLRIGCHMWLVLSLDRASNRATAHDSGNDDLVEIEISTPSQVSYMGKNVEFDLGLLGRFTLTNYFCLAVWAR